MRGLGGGGGGKNVSCIIFPSTMEIGIKVVWRVTTKLEELTIKPLIASCSADPLQFKCRLKIAVETLLRS